MAPATWGVTRYWPGRRTSTSRSFSINTTETVPSPVSSRLRSARWLRRVEEDADRVALRAAALPAARCLDARAHLLGLGVELAAELDEKRVARLQELAPVGQPLLVDGRLELRRRVGERHDADAPARAGAALLPLHNRRGDEAGK